MVTNKSRITVLLCILLCAPGYSQAIHEHFSNPEKDNPGNFRKMSDTGFTRIEDLLMTIPGVDVFGGQVCVRGESEPAMILVDGVQVYDLDSVSPSEVASVEVLKDPSQTAIYGIEGMYGVVSIRTKALEQTKIVEDDESGMDKVKNWIKERVDKTSREARRAERQKKEKVSALDKAKELLDKAQNSLSELLGTSEEREARKNLKEARMNVKSAEQEVEEASKIAEKASKEAQEAKENLSQLEEL